MRYFIFLFAFIITSYFNSSCKSCQGPQTTANDINPPVTGVKRCNCEAGLTLSTLNSSSSESYDGFLVGAQVGFNYTVATFGGSSTNTSFGDMDFYEGARQGGFSLTPGVLLSQQGSKYKLDDNTKGKVRTLNINLPVMVKYQTRAGFFAEAGVQPGFLLYAKDKYAGGSANYTSHMQRFDIGIPVGIGYEFDCGLGIGARFTRGLLKVEGPDKNTVAAFRVFYGF